MSVKIFLSTVSDEFRTYRDALRTDLTRHNVEVKVQEDFKDLGGDTLDNLDVHIAYNAVLDLLVKAYGEELARARNLAEGFIHEMAKRVAGNQTLDFEGMKQAVRNAIDIYEREIAGGQTQTISTVSSMKRWQEH